MAVPNTPQPGGGAKHPLAGGGAKHHPASGGAKHPPADAGDKHPPASGGAQTPLAGGGAKCVLGLCSQRDDCSWTVVTDVASALVSEHLTGLDDDLCSLIAPRRHVSASAPHTNVGARASFWHVGYSASQWTKVINMSRLKAPSRPTRTMSTSCSKALDENVTKLHIPHSVQSSPSLLGKTSSFSMCQGSWPY